MNKVKKLFKSSVRVIKDCCLENGAIVAANPTKSYYPSRAKHYFYVWPRDASYVCISADLIGIKGIQEKFFEWCLKRAEGFTDEGLFFEKYYVNGLKALFRFQPDQTGTVLFAVWHHYRKNLRKAMKFEELIVRAANGLCNKWDKDHFTIVTNDVWEERLAFPDLKENFTYSLAACIRGLESANQIIHEQRWLEVANQMRKVLRKHFIGGFFVRSHGLLTDKRIDSSVLGLVYPFEILKADDSRMLLTVKKIEETLLVNGGLHRYEHDDYDGWMYEGFHRRKGSGAWPILNFWLSIYYSILGNEEKARKYFYWVLDRVEEYIPEQIFENEIQVSVSPLAWSHAMFLVAAKFLKLV
ncbi:MAG: glycoside hydrolase family 15 protein [Candidatus Asgardarchaeia archaeon]